MSAKLRPSGLRPGRLYRPRNWKMPRVPCQRCWDNFRLQRQAMPYKSGPIPLRINAQTLEFGLKGCAVHSESLRCAVASAEPAMALPEGADDVFAFNCFQGVVALTFAGGFYDRKSTRLNSSHGS